MVKDHSSLSTSRTRPPNISLTLASEKRRPSIQIEAESPVPDDDDDDLDDTLQLSSSDSSAEPSPTIPALTLGSSDDDSIPDDISKEFAELHELRKSVQKNLRLRPIRSRGTLPKVDLDAPLPPMPKSPFMAEKVKSWQEIEPQPLSATSPTSSIESYFTPISETPHSAQFIGYTTSPPHPPTLTFNSFKSFTPPSPTTTTPSTSITASPTPKAISLLSPKSVPSELPKTTVPKIAAPSPPPFPVPLSAKALYDRLISHKRPLLIDTRPPATHLSFRIQHSINIAIPSLILKRSRKPGGGAFQTLDALQQFITTEQGKNSWDDLMRGEGERWDGDVVLYDDEMNEKDRENTGVTAWALVPVLKPLIEGAGRGGIVGYLEGGISKGGHDTFLETLIMSGDDDGVGEPEQQLDVQQQPALTVSAASPPGAPGKRKPSLGVGLFQLDTQTAAMKAAKKLPEIEPSSSTSSNPPSPPARSPLPMMTVRMPSAQLSPDHSALMDPTPSPPPSTIAFKRPAPPRRPSVPNLRKLDTKSTERLAGVPKLSLRTKMRSATLNIPPTLSLSGLSAPTSPSHLNLVYSSHSPPGSARWVPTSPGLNDPANYLTPYYTPPHTPGTPKPLSAFPSTPTTPHTARPDLDPPPSTDTESECAYPSFTVSTILPGFLYLGPELTEKEHVDELKGLGVRRILNIAAECDDDQGLGLKEVFERYVKIPMRDTVEEENIAKGVREVCEILDDARLHSAPTYVHCKAGKSRSVTAVMAYLIHANHWTLSRAYAFVLERRKGISPNIGFVSELMTFEEQELGGKSVGVQPSAPAGMQSDGTDGGVEFAAAVGGGGGVGGGGRRGAHVRESLPPALGGLEGLSGAGGPMSAGGLMDRVIGDSGQEMEIKDHEGRYRHARRAPVDENTLQPMRRVSKAGLESSAYA